MTLRKVIPIAAFPLALLSRKYLTIGDALFVL
jgi:hypothetical protein